MPLLPSAALLLIKLLLLVLLPQIFALASVLALLLPPLLSLLLPQFLLVGLLLLLFQFLLLVLPSFLVWPTLCPLFCRSASLPATWLPGQDVSFESSNPH